MLVQCVLFASVLLSALGRECPDDWIAFQDSCYIYVNDVATWTGAQTVCGILHSTLVEIESEEENDFIVSQMTEKHLTKMWMGLNDFVREGRYVWSSTLEEPEYFNWAPNEPNDDSHNSQLGDQDCGAIYVSGGWDDEYCESAHRQRFFCEQTGREAIIG